MIDLSIDDFLIEIEMELCSYEGLTEEDFTTFKKEFDTWILSNEGVKELGHNPTHISFENEDHVLETAANYVIAVIENETKKFWKSFSKR